VEENTMGNLTRRSFLRQTSASVATLSLLPAMPPLIGISSSPEAVQRELQIAPSVPIVAHVSDLAASEVTLFVGEREIIFRDPVVVRAY
jgi:hypothetical protein